MRVRDAPGYLQHQRPWSLASLSSKFLLPKLNFKNVFDGVFLGKVEQDMAVAPMQLAGEGGTRGDCTLLSRFGKSMAGNPTPSKLSKASESVHALTVAGLR